MSFVVKARTVFLSEFNKHKDLFPEANGESVFVGIIIHLLDHSTAATLDSIWFDRDDKKYGVMVSLIALIIVGFVPDVEDIYFRKQFKGSGHPFYESVY